VLEADCAITPDMLTLHNVNSLERLEPCGNGCPKPLLVMNGLQIERIQQVGGGRHMRLRLQKGHHSFNAIYFSVTAQQASVSEGDVVDVAFIPQVNDYRGERTVQMNIQDIRPSCPYECDVDTTAYRALCFGGLKAALVERLLPDRAMLGMVWRYLAACPGGVVQESDICLCRKIVRWAQSPLSLEKMLVCLDIFRDVGLIEIHRVHKDMTVRLIPTREKADLNQSATMRRLLAVRER
jgi:single-stranded-DNA-specific exonuclease